MNSRQKNGGKENSIQFELGKKEPVMIPTAGQEISFTIRSHDGIEKNARKKAEKRKENRKEPNPSSYGHRTWGT